MIQPTRILAIIVIAASFAGPAPGQSGVTEIMRWQYGKTAAVSLTWDDGSINQFRVAVPIMDRLGFPATFFIITGNIPGSRYHGAFIGRPASEIIRETAGVPTNRDNFFERASAIGFLGYSGTLSYHTRAGELYDEGKSPEKAYQLIDEGYAKVRQGLFQSRSAQEAAAPGPDRITWDELSALAQRGYELASHTVTHPRLAALDEPNLVYELEKSRQDLLDHLGAKHTFSVECPYGTENERAVDYALARYQTARNRILDSYVEDLDRGSKMDPGASTKEYVRWQRGPLTETPMALMKSWVDTIASHSNLWLVLVFHGVDSIGWKPKTGAELTEYFEYIKSQQDRLWVATFQDVTKYMRERMHGEVRSYREGNTISVVLRDDLKDTSYNLPLTLRTSVPSEWTAVDVHQGPRSQRVAVMRDHNLNYVLYQAEPNAEAVTLAPAN
ncbi:MAG: polysaccharide deacetylase family protein [Acidobacteriia bacterium]|nr:polysaccharide deacetylase family protein [Terriglobia bacterium]